MVFLTSSRGGQGGQIFLGVYLWVYYAVPENLFITPHYPYLKLRFFTRNHPTYFANIDTSDSLHPSHIQTRSYTYCCQSELHSYWLVVFRFGMAWFGLVTTWIDWVLLHQKTYPRACCLLYCWWSCSSSAEKFQCAEEAESVNFEMFYHQ